MLCTALDIQTAVGEAQGRGSTHQACEEAYVPAHSQSPSSPYPHRAPMMQLTLKLRVKLCNVTDATTQFFQRHEFT